MFLTEFIPHLRRNGTAAHMMRILLFARLVDGRLRAGSMAVDGIAAKGVFGAVPHAGMTATNTTTTRDRIGGGNDAPETDGSAGGNDGRCRW